jgi:alpha-glucosidase
MQRYFRLRTALFSVVLVTASTSHLCAAEVEMAMESVAVTIDASDRLQYEVTFRDRPVVERSRIAITLDGMGVTEALDIGQVEEYQIDETYPWRGVHSTAVNRCRGVKIPLTHTHSGTQFTLEVRVFADGAAFRYIIPGGEEPRVPLESTTFTLPAGSTVWYHDLGGHYEATYNRESIEEIEAGGWLAPPVTFALPGGAGYAAITEAALVNYSGMALKANGHRGLDLVLGHAHPISYPFELRYEEDIPRVSQPAAISGTITSPWRVVLVGPDLNTLVGSDVIHNLCPPPDPELFPDGMDTDWIKPGRAVWRYLDGGDRSLAGMKEFSRLAGELGFEYHVIEGFWSRWSDEEVQELVDYSRERGVGLFVWRHSNRLRTPEAREEFFSRLARLGIAGAKIDFFDHEHKEVVDLYPAMLEDAARHKILVNFHGSNKPTGEPRSWPNELVRESVRGMESSRLRERAVHDATLPFTRFLAGHAEYTAVHLGDRRADTTWAHQIATAAVFTAPLLTYAAHPESLLENPAVEIIKSIPAIWDETIVLPDSRIGEVAVFARRTGDVWFLAVVNGPEARELRVPLSFLAEGKYDGLVARDHAGDSAAVEVERATTDRSESIDIRLADSGGFMARFVPNRPGD